MHSFKTDERVDIILNSSGPNPLSGGDMLNTDSGNLVGWNGAGITLEKKDGLLFYPWTSVHRVNQPKTQTRREVPDLSGNDQFRTPSKWNT